VVYAALLNALRVVGKNMKDLRVVVLGVGAAGVAISKLLLAEGVGDIIGCNRNGILDPSDDRLDAPRRWLAGNTNKSQLTGVLSDAMKGADVLIGVSGPDLVTEDQLKMMAPKSIVFALANPNPEVDPSIARRHAAIVATGRSDEPNQINNVLAFPGIFRGLLDVGASQVNEDIEIAAGRAIANVVKESELSADYIVPTVFNPGVVTAVAAAVEEVVKSRR
jgi:malate dehydrogenase (oxaloacetate-decarboxylating)